MLGGKLARKLGGGWCPVHCWTSSARSRSSCEKMGGNFGARWLEMSQWLVTYALLD
jgi:hypothetical protein